MCNGAFAEHDFLFKWYGGMWFYCVALCKATLVSFAIRFLILKRDWWPVDVKIDLIAVTVGLDVLIWKCVNLGLECEPNPPPNVRWWIYGCLATFRISLDRACSKYTLWLLLYDLDLRDRYMLKCHLDASRYLATANLIDFYFEMVVNKNRSLIKLHHV